MATVVAVVSGMVLVPGLVLGAVVVGVPAAVVGSALDSLGVETVVGAALDVRVGGIVLEECRLVGCEVADIVDDCNIGSVVLLPESRKH